MKKPFISIIIPVYKSESYIHQCLDSVINQTFMDWECILVDDGSPDNCGAICDDYSIRDNRFKVVHKDNGGVSSARNVGLKIAGGGYLTFIDSDDYITNTYLEHLISPLQNDTSIDFVQAGCTNIIGGEPGSIEQRYEYYDSTNPTYLINEFRGLTISKIFLRNKIINSHNEFIIKFDENIKLAEDMVFTLQYLQTVNHYVFLSEVGYLYRRDNLQSITKTIRKEDYVNRLYCWKIIARQVELFITKRNISATEISKRMEVTGCMLNQVISEIYQTKRSIKERISILQKQFTNQDLYFLHFVHSPSVFQRWLNLLLLNRHFVGYDLMRTLHSHISQLRYKLHF